MIKVSDLLNGLLVICSGRGACGQQGDEQHGEYAHYYFL